MPEYNSDFERFIANEDHRRLFAQERTIVELTNEVCRLMKSQGVNRKELAARIGKTPSLISQMLSGGRNLTLRSVSDMFLAMGRSLDVTTRAFEDAPGRFIRLSDGSDWETEKGQKISKTIKPPRNLPQSIEATHSDIAA